MRRRFGNNDNPNCAQVSYCIRAMLSFKLRVCSNGNCVPQEELIGGVSNLHDRIDVCDTESQPNFEQRSRTEELLEDIDLESFVHLSLFVENVVVYIAGFVGRKLKMTLDCMDCVSSLYSIDMDSARMRDDFCLLLEKDQGGLIKPSDDLIQVCKIVERLIRAEQVDDIFKLNAKKIEVLVKRECVDRNIFRDLHSGIFSTTATKAAHVVHCEHRLALISHITRIFCKTRFNYIAKRSSLQAKPTSNRSRLTKLVHFSGF